MELTNNDFKWYMISTVSGKEENVIESLKNKIAAQRMDEYFKDIRLSLIHISEPTRPY